MAISRSVSYQRIPRLRRAFSGAMHAPLLQSTCECIGYSFNTAGFRCLDLLRRRRHSEVSINDVMTVGLARNVGQRSKITKNSPESNIYKNLTEPRMKKPRTPFCSPIQAGSNAFNFISPAATMAEHGDFSQGHCRKKFKN